MNRVAEGRVKKTTAIAIFLYWLIAVSSVARILQVFPGRVPMLVIVALHVLPPLLFAWIHGAISYGLRGILTFSAISIIVGSIVENIGVLTGFPFGHYYFTDVMGPKIFLVPIFLGLAYLGMGCLSWTLARVILGHTENALIGSRVITRLIGVDSSTRLYCSDVTPLKSPGVKRFTSRSVTTPTRTASRRTGRCRREERAKIMAASSMVSVSCTLTTSVVMISRIIMPSAFSRSRLSIQSAGLFGVQLCLLPVGWEFDIPKTFLINEFKTKFQMLRGGIGRHPNHPGLS